MAGLPRSFEAQTVDLMRASGTLGSVASQLLSHCVENSPGWIGTQRCRSEGHDSELKQTYASLIQLEHPPRLVLDIGANYGTHSIIFLSHDIETVSFEPNP